MRVVWTIVCAACVALVGPACAQADVFGPISLVSEGSLADGEAQQAEYAHDPAISGNGQYVVFDGSFGGVTGVWRRDLQKPGALEQVAGGDAELPSISSSGQYVSFTTNEGLSLPEASHGRLDSSPHPEAANVYVRDMAVQPAASAAEEAARPPGERAFKVVSAVDGSQEPLTYVPGAFPTKEGSMAVGRSAISAGGAEVAFVTSAVSNLVRYPQIEKEEEERGETPKPHTPPLQVAVRYLDTGETVLVSRCYAHCEPNVEPAVASVEGNQVYGAVFPGASALFKPPPAYGEYEDAPPPGASISADGSTVAWMGENIGQQAALLGEEVRSSHYTEPLWRRIEPGSETATERVTGGSDPGNPACTASGERSLPTPPSSSDPCQGPFAVEEEQLVSGIWNAGGGQTGDFVPRLSADGYTVAFISEAPLVEKNGGGDFGRGFSGQASDLYVANMHAGLTRDQALTKLTKLAGGESSGLADTAPIVDFDISPDGNQVAFTTARTEFVLGWPAFVSTPAGEAGMNELFDADLADGTLTRVTHGYKGPNEAGERAHKQTAAGEDPYKKYPEDGALSPSFSEDGDLLAFASTASNLVFGDGNAPPLGSPSEGSFDGSDVLLVASIPLESRPTPNYASSSPEPAFEPVWSIGVTASSQANGTVSIYVETPGAGVIRAGARGEVVAAFVHAARTAGHASRVPAGRMRKSHPQARSIAKTVAMRTVAMGSLHANGAGLSTLKLTLARPYGALARQQGGFSARITVTFTAPGRQPLQDTLPVTFLQRKPKRVRGRPRKQARKSASRSGRR